MLRTLWTMATLMVATGWAVADDKPKPKAETLELAGLTGALPEDWEKEEPSNSMRMAQFKLPKAEDDKDDAELAVFVFPGGSGTVKQNLERQIAKFVPEGRTDKDEKIKLGELDAVYQDVAGTYKKKPFPMATDFTPVPGYRQLYVVFEAPDKKQYYMTLLGPKASVEKHEKAFKTFLASFK